jgi:hypothetical protein
MEEVAHKHLCGETWRVRIATRAASPGLGHLSLPDLGTGTIARRLARHRPMRQLVADASALRDPAEHNYFRAHWCRLCAWVRSRSAPRRGAQ